MVPRRCAVLGSPITHSLSPVLHRRAYAELGLDWSYEAYDVAKDGLEPFLDQLDRSWRGLSLTMPLKRAAISLCDEVSEQARVVGAVNTIVFDAERGLLGSNTDVPGMVGALRERGVDEASSALVLGVGATACSTVAALAGLGVRRVEVLARRPERAAELESVGASSGVDVRVRAWSEAAQAGHADLAVSTVPAAAAAEIADELGERCAVVFDVIYDPWPTLLAVRAHERDRVVLNGFDLLVHQAVLQVQAMTGVSEGPLASMRAAGEDELAARADVR